MKGKWPGLHTFWKDKLFVKKRFQPYSTSFLGHKLYVHDQASFRLGYKELFRHETYKFLATKQAPKIIDCGSNIGMSIIYFKTLYPDASITAFEADPFIFSYMEKNVHSFQFKNVNLHNKAVWDTNDESLSFYAEGGAGGRIANKGDDEREKIIVKTSRLRDYLNGDIDFLKLDIEGAEYNVIKDCADQLFRVQHLFIEYHSMAEEPQNLHLILDIVNKAGFRYHIKEAYTTAFPYISRKLNVGMDLQLNVFCFR